MIQSQNELQHHGILGMRWHVRRYQNKDGSLTPAGKKRADKLAKKYEKTTGRNITDHKELSAPKHKPLSEMTNEEVQARIDRLRLEQTLASLTPKQVSKGEAFAKWAKDKGIYAADTLYKNAMIPYMEKKLKEAIGLNAKNTSQALKKEADDWENRKKIAKAKTEVARETENLKKLKK